MPKVGVNKYMSTIMTDWGSIQSRSVDPYANVDSDVANAQHIRMGNSRMFYTGLALESFEVDSSNNLLLGTFSAGTVVMDNVSIEFTSSFTIALVSFPNLVSTTKDIVVYYHYEKTKPAPVASIKIIDDTNYDSSTQLKLYTYITGSWSSVIFIKDVKNDKPINTTFYEDGEFQFPIPEVILTQPLITTLINAGYKRLRPVIAYSNLPQWSF